MFRKMRTAELFMLAEFFLPLVFMRFAIITANMIQGQISY